MGFEDKTLTCSDCGATFTFTAAEQELFHTKGYTNEPKRCPSCRETRKARRSQESGSGASGSRSYGSSNYASARREMFPVKCAECGKDTMVPFQPRGDRPVYCSDCYRKIKPAR